MWSWNEFVQRASNPIVEDAGFEIFPHRAKRLNWHRMALGLMAVVSWALAAALFRGYAIALLESRERESWLLWFASWTLSLAGLLIILKSLARPRT